MIKKAWKIITPLLSAVIGVCLANKFNIFDFLPFVPNEYTYEICITAYFAVIDIIIDFFMEFFSDILRKRLMSELSIIISQQGASLNVDSDAFLDFNSDGLTQANVLVKMRGKKKAFKDVDLIIKKPAFAEIQNTYKRPEVKVREGNYCINLEKLFGNSDTIDSSQTFRFAMILDIIDGETSVVLYPSLSRKRIGLVYKHNNVHLKAVEK